MAISVNCVYASVPFEKVPQKLLARRFHRVLGYVGSDSPELSAIRQLAEADHAAGLLLLAVVSRSTSAKLLCSAIDRFM